MKRPRPPSRRTRIAALADAQLQRALSSVGPGLAARRGAARPACRSSRRCARRVARIKDHTLANLDAYLEAFEGKASEAGSVVHFAP